MGDRDDVASGPLCGEAVDDAGDAHAEVGETLAARRRLAG